MTSSKSSSAPSRSAIARRPSRKPGAGATTPMLAATGSTAMTAMRFGCARKRASTDGEVVVARGQREAGERARDAGRARNAERRDARARRDEKRVGVPVVAARELQDEVAARRAAREAHRAHRGFRARGHEPHLLHRRERLRDALGELDLALRRRAVGRAARQRAAHGRQDRPVRVPEDERPVRHDPVDVPVSVRVDQRRAAALLHEERLAAHGRERAHGRRHAAGHALLRRARKRASDWSFCEDAADGREPAFDASSVVVFLRRPSKKSLLSLSHPSHSAASFA